MQHVIRQQHTQTDVVTVGRPHVVRSKDQQLIRMLLVEIITYVMCKFPVTIGFIYQQITKNNEKTAEQQMIEQSVMQLTFFLYFVENSVGCYTNILVSQTFRAELKQILGNICHLCFRQSD